MTATPVDAEKQQAPTTTEGEPHAAGGKPKMLVMIAVLVAAAGAGAGAGFMLAPHLAAHGAKPAVEPEEKEHGKSGTEGAGRIFKIDNLIVNPAGSEGSRFLMTSVAFEVETEAAENALKDHDIQLRDLVVSRLESQTMQMLTQPFARDSLKRQLAAAVAAIIGPRAKVSVYLPQFVIQ